MFLSIRLHLFGCRSSIHQFMELFQGVHMLEQRQVHQMLHYLVILYKEDCFKNVVQTRLTHFSKTSAY